MSKGEGNPMKRSATTMSRRNFMALCATAAVAGFGSTALTGCGSSDSGKNAAADVKAREDLNVALSAQPESIDPLMTVGNVTAEVCNCIWEPLYAMDDSYKPQPVLATSYSVSDDGLVYTFDIKSGVKFHDGTEMTADDVVASMNRWVAMNSRAQTLFPKAKWKKVSDTQVSFTVPSAASDIMLLLANYQQFGAIMPKAAIESAGKTGITEFIGTGPYAYDEWAQDQYIHLTKFEDYHGVDGEASGFAGARNAQAKDLYFHIAADPSTRVSALIDGQYDIIDSVPTASFEELESNDAVKTYTNTGGYLCVYMNTTKNSQLNQTLRQAVEYSIDCEGMLKSVYGDGFYTLDYGYMNPSMEQWKVDGGTDWYNKHDLDRAKELLDEGGYNGETIILLTTGDYQQMAKGTEYVAECLRQIGVKCKIETYEFAKYMEKKATYKGWDICVATQSYQTTPAQLNVVNPSFNGLDDKQILDGIAAVRAAKDDAAATEEWSKVQERLYEHGAGYVVGHSLSISATAANIESFDNFVVPVAYNAYAAE